ncbi:MAG: tetratricopeptide repeat protein, partial [Deltaproteobacteria bacterium]|nr:tetratricopeptide repeat protein [Deltaproteobacteria bacterium]
PHGGGHRSSVHASWEAEGYDDPNDFRPSVPVEQDALESLMESDAGFAFSGETAALDEDDGRLRPYVDEAPAPPVSSGAKAPRGRVARSLAHDVALNDKRSLRGDERIHEQVTGKARSSEIASRRGSPPDRTSWITLMLGDSRRQRWIRGTVAVGIVMLALAGGFLFRYLRLGHQVERKRTAATSILRQGNMSDYVKAAQQYEDIIKSRRDKKGAWLVRARIRAAMAFEFGSRGAEGGTEDTEGGLDSAVGGTLAIYHMLADGKLDEADVLAFRLRNTFRRNALLHYLAGRILLLKENAEAAETQLLRATELEGRDAVYWRAYGDALVAQGHEEKAQKAYARALVINSNHVATKISQARLFLRRGKLSKASDLIQELTEGRYHAACSRGQRGWSYALLARLRVKEGKIARARAAVDRAQGSAPLRDATFYDALADVLIDAFAPGAAESLVNRSYELMPGRPHPIVAKARIYLRQGRILGAWKVLKGSKVHVSSAFKARILLRLGRLTDAERHVRNALKRAPNSLDARLVQAELLRAQGKLDDAENKLRTLIARNSDDARLLTALGEVLLRKKRFESARAQFQLAVKASPTALEAKCRLADVLVYQGKYEKAHELLIQESSKNPWYVPIIRRVAELDFGEMDLKEAEKNFNAVIKASPGDARARLGLVHVRTIRRRFAQAADELKKVRVAPRGALELAQGRLALEQGDLKRAREKLKVARRELPGETEPWLLSVHGYVLANDLKAAEKLTREMERRFPSHPVLFEMRGWVALSRGKARQAADAFRAAVKRVDGTLTMPKDLARLWVRLGRAQYSNSKVEKALASFRKAKVICKGCPEPYFREGLALDELGRGRQAIGALEKARSLAPERRQVYSELGKIYANDGQKAKALEMYKKYLSMNPPEDLAEEARRSVKDLNSL